MFDEVYRVEPLGTKRTHLSNPIKETLFRFQGKKRKYFVIAEEYDFGFIAIKYCALKDKSNKRSAYSKIFNDGDAFRIIGTCIHIMYSLWKKNPHINFAFYAVPRNIDASLFLEKKIAKRSQKKFIENYKRTRFNIYEYAMLNLFPPSDFAQLRDYANCIYVLINKKAGSRKILLAQLAEFLLQHHQIIFHAIQHRKTHKSHF